jgi:D-galactarolactone cycloisomerase
MNVVDCEVDILDNVTGTQSLPAETGSLDVDIRSVLVRLRTDDGLTGLGESFTHSAAPEDALALARRIEALGRRVVGEDPLNVRALWHDLYDRLARS